MITTRTQQLEQRLLALAKQDAEKVFVKDVEYGHSWRKRDGVGAFFVIARKWDRLEERVKRDGLDTFLGKKSIQYDLFGHIAADNREEGIIDDIRDLRRYLLLVEEEMMARGSLRDILKDVLEQSDSARTDSVRGRTDHPRPFGYEPEQDNLPEQGGEFHDET